ncbi:MAG: hypothetical protein V3R54_06485 [Thermodesulfovibrionia bacterium]
MQNPGNRIIDRNLIKKSFLTAICLLLIPSLSFASNFTPLEKKSLQNFLTGFNLSGYIEIGKKSQAEDFEEEEEDREYTYQNYHLRLKHKLSDRFNYMFSSFIYDKDYESTDSLDNISKIFNAKGSYYLNKQKKESLKLDIRLKYKEKRFRNSPAGEYDQIIFSPRLTYTKKDAYTINVSIGVNDYDYRNIAGNDQFKFFSKIEAKRYLLEKKLMLTSSYKLEITAHKRANRRKNKNDFMAGFDYRFDKPLIHKITARAKLGQRDTKDDDERDEDFDYRYREFYVKIESRITSKTKATSKYHYFKKDYLTADLDHSGFYILIIWRYTMLADETQGLYFNFISKHKEVNYPTKSGRDYKKETLEIKGTYRRKKNWKTSASLQGNFYDYKDSTRDKNRYYSKISFDKLFPEKKLVLSLYFKYKYTDNRHANNTEAESVRLAFRYKF